MSAEELPWVNCWDLLSSSGLRNLTRSGSEGTFSCFSGNHSHGDSTPSAGMNLKTSLWQCRSPACGLRGNGADFLAALHGITRSEALRRLEERYGGEQKSVAAGELEEHVKRIREQAVQTEEHRIRPTWDFYREAYSVGWERVAKTLTIGHSPWGYMLGRGFLPEVLDTWRIGYDRDTDRITIPVVEGGELIGIKARAWREEVQPRYLILGAQLSQSLYGVPFNTYRKGDYVFGLDVACSSAVIVEGELNVIALAQIGVSAVAVAGAEFSEQQRRKIVSACEEVTIFFDPDEAGRKGSIKVAEMLSSDLVVKIVVDQQGDAARALEHDAQFGPQEVRQWIADAVPYAVYRRQLTNA